MITAFLPCRKGSQRIHDKNVKPFGGVAGGLLEIKLSQLVEIHEIDSIIVSSNDERVLEMAAKVRDSRIKLDERPDHLGSSTTTTDHLIEYVSTLIHQGDVLWTHVTSPFVDANDYQKMLAAYRKQVEHGYDSLMTAVKVQGFIWDEQRPINYDRSKLKWPATQTLSPLYEIDSAAFIANIAVYKQLKDRIGEKPFLYIQDKRKAMDIDWPDDFYVADQMWLAEQSAAAD